MDILQRIIETKRARVAEAKLETPLPQMTAQARTLRAMATAGRFAQALSTPGVNIIAEIKRASPSKGVIRNNVDPIALAKLYEAGGAAAISVLTEADYFQGSLQDLRMVRDAVSPPLLRKDFIFDEYQIYESAAAGADAILLIVAALDDTALCRFQELAHDLGMSALVEVHTRAEMERAVAIKARLIGVNNRDLHTFNVSLETSVSLASMASPAVILVSESGIECRADIDRLRNRGYQGFLIGETLMRCDHPDAALRELIGPLCRSE
jgi:indole-3-glycerol phosphate synthase